MRVSYIVAALVISNLLISNVHAEPWQVLGHTADGMKMGIDAGSIRSKPPIPYTRDFPVTQVWTEFLGGKGSKANVLYTRQLISIDCAGERSTSLSMIAYGQFENVIDSSTQRDVDYNYEPIPPGTLVATIMQRICKK